MGYRIGVDVGGTFTDFLVVSEEGRSQVFKTMTTPADPSEGFFAGLATAATQQGLSLPAFLGQVEVIVHGTTITTNATLTGNGARVGFLTTEGFRDALNMRRGLRERQYDSKHSPPPPLVPRYRIRTARERVACDGSVVEPLHDEDVAAAADFFRREQVEAVAVSYLFSFFNPVHERRTRELLAQALPGAYVTISSEVIPQVRLYERNSTTALNAYVGPPLARYLSRLQNRLAESGFRGTLLIMQSNGGVMAPEVASRFAVNTLLSGPAAGPVAGLAFTRDLGLSNIITVDMGGTSFDICLVAGGQAALTTDARVAGYHIATPSLDMHTIGSGGGSIAWVDAGGMLRVGPQSAGAAPGPACYGRGGTEPTVTDANLILGYLDPEYFHGGELRLDRAAAERAVGKIADALGLSLVETAAGIFRIVNANMADGLRVMSVQRGHNPKEFALVVAGGAGPIHATDLARELGIPLTVIPRDASVFCAVGMLLTDLQHDYVRTFASTTTGIDLGRLQATLNAMRDEAVATLRREGVAAADVRVSFSADVRYIGQFNEVEVPLGREGEAVTAETVAAMVSAFHEVHDARFGYALPAAPTEIVNVRARARGLTPKPAIARSNPGAGPTSAWKGSRPVYFGGEFRTTPVYDALRLGAGDHLEGPAVLEQPTTTIVVPPEYAVTVAENGTFLLYAAAENLDAILADLRR